MSSGDPRDVADRFATQLAGPVRPVEPYVVGAMTIRAGYRIDPDDPILGGHYPGFPLYPGVCLLECAHRSVLLVAAGEGVSLRAVELRAAHFLAPGFPGDTVDIAVSVTPRADRRWEAKAVLTSGERHLAKTTLRYEVQP